MSALRQHRFALALLAVLAGSIFLPSLLRREVLVVRDHFDYFQPLRYFTAQELRAGNLPLWNPYSASGEPWLANPQTGIFYPPAWLFVALPFDVAYSLFLLVHLVILGWGSYLLFERFSSREAAMVGAAALILSGPVLSLLDISNNLATLAWIPVALWCAARGAWIGGGFALALAFLGGEPFFAALGALLYLVVRRRLDVVGTALVAVGVSAVQLFPFLEFVARSDRAGGMEDSLILRDSMPLAEWWRLAVPSSLAERAGPSAQGFIPLVYAGAIVVLLALVGLAATRRSRATVALAALAIAAAALASGPQLLTQLPLTIFRYPARLIPIVALALAGLAAAGWNRLRPQRRWADLLLVLVIAGDLLLQAQPLLQTAPFTTDVIPYNREIGATGKILRFGEIDPRMRAEWISGYLNLYDRRFDEFTAAPLAAAPYVAVHRQLLQSPTFREFARAGVVYILTRYDLPRPWVAIHSSRGLHLYRNGDAWPMAAHFSPGSRSVRHARWELGTSSARIRVNAARDGVLVLRQQAAPGWEVTVDGVRSEALVIDGVYRGVDVPAGRHEVVWRYRPASLYAGAATTIVSLLAMQFALFVKRRKRSAREKNFSSGSPNVQ